MGSLEKLKCAWKKGLGFGDNPHGWNLPSHKKVWIDN